MDENTLNDLLECSVCLERLDTSSKVLPCQHTFCRKCLEVIYASRQELRCPECRVLVDTKIDDLPPNVLLMRILEGMKNASSKQQAHSSASENISSTSNASLPQQQLLPPAESNETSERPQTLHAHQQQQQQLTQQAKFRPHNAQFQQQQAHNVQPQQHVLPIQQRRCIVPHAYAQYDFNSNEPTDLKFKKGDLILLRRKIDNNWYVGQCKGVEGNFPLNYVQVVVPLPSSQCVALYDFKMGPNEEEGCLTFKKGTIIQVLRRVDHNWAEGRIGSAIGIFPIAFVELNHLAKQLLESNYMSAVNSKQQQSANNSQQPNDVRIVPPIPAADVSSVPSQIDATRAASSTVPPDQQPSSSSSSSSVSSSANTSPISTTANGNSSSVSTTTSSLNTVFHSMPNSPDTSGPTSPQHSAYITNASSSVRLRNNDLKHKRHSLNALLSNGATALSIMQTNRHSAEILSVPNEFDQEAVCDTTASAATGQTTAAREQQHHTSNVHNSLHSPQPAAAQHSQANTNNMQQATTTSRHNVLKTCVQQNMPPSLPWGYLALYPYKPRKTDELELKKGCVYMVTERCLDGWFKGKNWKDISGVFPGNYVTPLRARDQQQLMHSWKLVPPSNYPLPLQNVQSQNHQSAAAAGTAAQHNSNYSISMRNDLENINARLTLASLTPHQAMPPDLPPRQMTVSPTTVPQQPQQQQMLSKENRDKEAQKEKPTTTGCMSTSASSNASSASSSASAGLKKFLTHIKSRSKSPGAAITAAQANSSQVAKSAGKQTQISDGGGGLNTLTPVHVRSGSCPSQLLQTFPADVKRGSSNENSCNIKQTNPQQLQQPQQVVNYGSQRIKGPKERTSLDNQRPTIDSTLRSIYANHIQQQSALMPNKCGQQYQQPMAPATASHFNPTMVVHRKSHSLDASNILQASNSNNIAAPPAATGNAGSTAATQRSIGGGTAATAMLLKSNVSPQCNINAAAIHASATTKSTQNATSESRFRCVVPYPPNSDVELELQVGDIIFVYRKQKNGWYKGTNSRTYKTGLFPASFVEPDL